MSNQGTTYRFEPFVGAERWIIAIIAIIVRIILIILLTIPIIAFGLFQLLFLDYWIIAIIVIALLRANSKFASINPEIKRAFLAQKSLGKMIQYVLHCFCGLQRRFCCHIFVDPVRSHGGPNERISEGNVAIFRIITII